MELNIVEELKKSLDSRRDELSDLHNATKVDDSESDGDDEMEHTFDLDLDTQLATKTKKKGKTLSQLKREQREVDTFKSTFHYFDKKRREDSIKRTGRSEKEMDVVENISEIENLDAGKTWKQLDNWLRRKKIVEFAKTSTVVDYEKTLLALYDKGEFRKASHVVYDSKEGIIKELHSKNLVYS